MNIKEEIAIMKKKINTPEFHDNLLWFAEVYEKCKEATSGDPKMLCNLSHLEVNQSHTTDINSVTSHH
jgi:translation initiation factor 2 beta subunit (eIF-2beta)/eIF-5